MREDTNPGLMPLERPQEPSPIKRWMVILGLIAALGTAGTTLVQWINWPFEDKVAAAEAHKKLQEGIDTMREEHRQGDERLLEAINKLGDKLGGKRK